MRIFVVEGTFTPGGDEAGTQAEMERRDGEYIGTWIWRKQIDPRFHGYQCTGGTYLLCNMLGDEEG